MAAAPSAEAATEVLCPAKCRELMEFAQSNPCAVLDDSLAAEDLDVSSLFSLANQSCGLQSEACAGSVSAWLDDVDGCIQDLAEELPDDVMNGLLDASAGGCPARCARATCFC